VKGPRTPSREQEFETEQDRPTRRERSAKHRKKLPKDPDRPHRATRPKVWERSAWEEDDYLDDDDGPNIWDVEDDADPGDDGDGAAHDR
jgi:hypothetical protein